MPTANTTPTETYQEAAKNQAQGDAKIEKGKKTVEGKIQKAEGVASAQKAPNIDMNDVENTHNQNS